MPNCLSLFSGLGGDTLGMESAGFKCIAFNEINKHFSNVHLDNFPDCTSIVNQEGKGDITKIQDREFEVYRGNVDLVFAGFPCQGFSHAGKKDDADPRNKLFYEFLRIAHITNPRFIIGENVPGLLRRKTDDQSMNVIDKIAQEFATIGYTLTWKVLDSSHFGVPQARKRLFIVGFKYSEDYSKWDWDTLHVPSGFDPDPKGVGVVIDPTSLDRAICIDNDIAGGNDTVHYMGTTQEVIGTPHPYLIKKVGDREISFGRRASPTHSEILDPSKPCKTLISTYARMPRLLVGLTGDDGKRWIRTLTPDEGKQIQGFPEDYKLDQSPNDTNSWVMIGNAAPPPVVGAISSQIKYIIDTSS
jgi:DNA (cytosine-5)-methyltransferase 1